MDNRTCVVQDCLFDKKRKFSFPPAFREEERVLKWIAACGNAKLKKRKNFICEAHFEKRYILGTKLSVTAVPTLNLPEPLDNSLCLEKLKELRETQPPGCVIRPHIVPPQHPSIAEEVQDADDGAQTCEPSNMNLKKLRMSEVSEIENKFVERNLPGRSGVVNNIQRLHQDTKKKSPPLILWKLTRTKDGIQKQEKVLYNEMCNSKNTVKRLRRRNADLTHRLKHVEHFLESSRCEFFPICQRLRSSSLLAT